MSQAAYFFFRRLALARFGQIHVRHTEAAPSRFAASRPPAFNGATCCAGIRKRQSRDTVDGVLKYYFPLSSYVENRQTYRFEAGPFSRNGMELHRVAERATGSDGSSNFLTHSPNHAAVFPCK